MTESDWLACEDPQAMLRHFSPTSTMCHHQVSDRKLLMFSFACGERCDKINRGESPSGMEPMPWAMRWANPKAPTWIKGPNRITQKEKADFLRDIVGNPFRPVALPLNRIADHTQATDYFPDGIPISECSWLTPTVLAIAQSAYDERPGRKCERCKGTGKVRPQGWDDGRGTRDYNAWAKCNDGRLGGCHGTGCIEDGNLDPVTLAILADALEDAGCDNADILMHLRGKQQCNCESNYDAYTRGCDCNGSGWKTMERHHVRGCHVLDIILVKE